MQLIGIFLVSYLSILTFSIPRDPVSLHNNSLLYVGLLLTEYFIFVVGKDLVIMISQIFFGGFMGFWHGIILHIVTMPIDVLILLILCVWGTAVMTQEGTAKCIEDSECRPFVR